MSRGAIWSKQPENSPCYSFPMGKLDSFVAAPFFHNPFNQLPADGFNATSKNVIERSVVRC